MKKILLEDLLGSKKKISLLRYLAVDSDWSFNLSFVARQVRMDKSTVSKLLVNLEDLGLMEVRRQDKRMMFRLKGEVREYLMKIFSLEK